MNRATLWARVLLDELVGSGLSHLAVAPGSRSTPLVLQAAERSGLRITVHLDERSAAFFALGVGKATGRPGAVLTTSGTAVANLLPAVVEASRSETPLLLLTADRPHHLGRSGSNQTMDQVGIFGGFVREALDLPDPSLRPDALRHLRRMACQAVAAAVGLPGGPVHLNVRFDKPLEPDADGADPGVEARMAFPGAVDGRPDGAPWVRVGVRRPAGSAAEVQEVARLLTGARRPVIVAGPAADSRATGPAVAELARAARAPLLADPLSGARWPGAAGETLESGAVAGYDLFLGSPAVREALEPDVVLRVGSMPTSAVVARWLRRWDGVLQLLVDPAHGWKDAVPSASRLVRAEPSGFVGAVAREMDRERREEGGGGDGAGGAGPTAWERRWRQVGSVARTLAREAHAEAPFEGTILADVVAALPAGAPLFVSSSMPVRDLDAFGEPRGEELHVVGNRGASGIDGVVSTALGVAAASGRPAVCVLGDLAFFHDANGLLATREEGVAAVFVVVQNDGGGIFHMLPVADHEPAFTPYFATPHGLDFRHLADLHGLVHRPLPWEGPEDREMLGEALDDALRRAAEEDRSTVLEVHTDRRETHRRLRELRARVEGAALDALRA